MVHLAPQRLSLACFAFSIAVSALCTPSKVAAQSTTVTLHGKVAGSDGSVPQGAEIEVRSRETAASRSGVTGPDGSYRVLGLAPGVYEIGVRAIGYRQQRMEGVQLVLGQRATVNFVLEPGTVELDPIVVTAQRAFEVDRSDVSTPVSQEEIEKLPLNSRNVLNVAGIAPGVRTFAVESGRSQPVSGALPVTEPRFNNLYVDGLELKGTYVGQVLGIPALGSMIPQEAVREFRVYLNSYDAEYTRGASHVISAVTHQGGNTFEGSVFGFLQNKPLVARGSFQAEKPDYSRYQIGGNIRGPILKNQLYLAASYEGQSTDHFIDVVATGPPDNPGIWDRYEGTFKAPTRHHTGLLRLTAPLGVHTVDATWATRHNQSETGFGTLLDGRMAVRQAGLGGNSHVNSVQLRDTYASKSLVNELSLQFLDLRNTIIPLEPGPAFRYPAVHVGRHNFPLRVVEHHLRAINKASYTAGEHVLKGGLEVTRLWTTVFRPNFNDGLFTFNSDIATQPNLGQIALGRSDPSSTREAEATIRGWFVGAYLQDQWQLVPSLTVTAGLRYDADINTLNQKLITPWAGDTTLRRVFGEEFLNTGDRKNDLDNIAPRLALVWDVFGSRQTFLRGGYGIMYDRVPLFGTLNEAISLNWRTYTFSNPGTTDPNELKHRVLAGDSTTAQNIILMKDRLKAPANNQWSVGVGHQLTDNLAVNLDYLDQRVRNAYVTVTTNQAVNSIRPITNRFGNVTVWDDFGDATFRALLASVTYDRRRTRLNLAYTLGWSKSEFGDFTTSDYPDAAAYSLQWSETDERHRFVVSGLTELPWGVEFSGIAILASPRPFLVRLGHDLNQNGNESDDWPNGERTLRQTGWDHWYRTLDLRLGKSFSAPYGRLTVTAEVFNVLSSANHAEYQAKQSESDYGEPVGDYARRQAQVGVRYQF